MKWKSQSAGCPSAAKASFLTGRHWQTAVVKPLGRRKVKSLPIHGSGVFLLQEHYWQQLNLRSRLEAQQHTYAETHNALDTLCRIAFGIQQGSSPVDFEQGQCTFLLVGVVYQGLSALLTIGKQNPSAEIRESITILRWLLRHLRTRWPLSGKSLSKTS